VALARVDILLLVSALGAQSWRDNDDGMVRFVAKPNEVLPSESLYQSSKKTNNE
jgi:hypothetical protein